MEGYEVSFVTWPDGKVDDASLTVCGEHNATERLVRTWLPVEWFGDAISYPIQQLWRGMENKGFRVHTIVVGKDGEPKLKDRRS